MADATQSSAPNPASPARRFGAPAAAGVPKREDVRVTAPDLARRHALDKTRERLVIAGACFALLFTAVAGRLTLATVVFPAMPKEQAAARRPEPPAPPPAAPAGQLATAAVPEPPRKPAPGEHQVRATITDRNGEILAISLPTASVFANPKEMIDPDDAAAKLKTVLTSLDVAQARARLASAKQFVYLARHITPRDMLAINNLGIPGVYFEPTERRRYPLGRVAAHILGGVDVDLHGVAGVELTFDQRLKEDPEPLRLSVDVRVQAVIRDELTKAIADFTAIGGCGIVMDVRTGEVLGMVSLPDYDTNDIGHAGVEERKNRAVTQVYEPGSTFKLQTAAMTLDSGIGHLWNIYDASAPIHIGRFSISDFEGKHRPLYFPEVLAYSSNIGAAHMAQSVGAEKQREWLGRMGMLAKLGIELPGAARPIAPPVANWKEAATLTIGFGHGIAVSPLHVVRGTAAIANGGIVLRPTILARPADAAPPSGERVMQQSTSDTLRRLMRLVVTDGYGKTAEVPGYFVGGKTGTAEKVGAKGGYKKHANVAAFMSVFPMNAPRYAVYMMLDEPHANATTHGYATAGWVAAPAAGRVIARIGPMLGLLPETDNAAAIQASLAIPLQPGRPPNVAAKPPTPRPVGKPTEAQRDAALPTEGTKVAVR
jgi:cell division protein FtsI (penicillin-binding protein 3)